MVGAIIFLVIVALVVVVAMSVYLRSWVQAESRTEAHMRDPHTHTVAYAIPNGVDPVLVKVELSRAGFNTGIGRVGGRECLRIECERQHRVRAAATRACARPHRGPPPERVRR
jgi:hypothetical protein